MKETFKAFMAGLIDYAGLFPPARLDLEPALENYAQYLRGRHAWMLGRFILPAARLDELEGLAEKYLTREYPFPFSLLLSSGALEADALKAVAREVTAIKEFFSRHEGRARAEVLETAFPGDTAAAGAPEPCTAYLSRIDSLLKHAGLKNLELFAEVPPTEDWRKGDASATAGIAAFQRGSQRDTEHDTKRDSSGGALIRTGFKLRCGGLDPAAFPTIERMAQVIHTCREKGIAFKCTAGLHRLLRHYSKSTGAVHHGIFNVFGAALLALGGDMPLDRIENCLAEEKADSFHFQDHAFSWQHFVLSPEKIKILRRDQIMGFGSCSFDEPVEDLIGLGLLE